MFCIHLKAFDNLSWEEATVPDPVKNLNHRFLMRESPAEVTPNVRHQNLLKLAKEKKAP